MEEQVYRTWRDFRNEDDRRFGTFQLSLNDLACDFYHDEKEIDEDEPIIELDFDR